MNPPSDVWVGPCRYRIRVDGAAMATVRREREAADAIGQHDGVNQEIILDPELAPDGLAAGLLHELLHAILAQQPDLTKHDDEDLEEAVCQGLGPALLDLLRRNGRLADYLCGGSR